MHRRFQQGYITLRQKRILPNIPLCLGEIGGGFGGNFFHEHRADASLRNTVTPMRHTRVCQPAIGSHRLWRQTLPLPVPQQRGHPCYKNYYCLLLTGPRPPSTARATSWRSRP